MGRFTRKQNNCNNGTTIYYYNNGCGDGTQAFADLELSAAQNTAHLELPLMSTSVVSAASMMDIIFLTFSKRHLFSDSEIQT